MATRKTSPLDAGPIVRKGETAPAEASKAAPPPWAVDTIAVTVKTAPEQYMRLKDRGTRLRPRKTDQQILVEALEAYLDQEPTP
jgi:hypothetical protein